MFDRSTRISRLPLPRQTQMGRFGFINEGDFVRVCTAGDLVEPPVQSCALTLDLHSGDEGLWSEVCPSRLTRAGERGDARRILCCFKLQYCVGSLKAGRHSLPGSDYRRGEPQQKDPRRGSGNAHALRLCSASHGRGKISSFYCSPLPLVEIPLSYCPPKRVLPLLLQTTGQIMIRIRIIALMVLLSSLAVFGAAQSDTTWRFSA